MVAWQCGLHTDEVGGETLSIAAMRVLLPALLFVASLVMITSAHSLQVYESSANCFGEPTVRVNFRACFDGIVASIPWRASFCYPLQSIVEMDGCVKYGSMFITASCVVTKATLEFHSTQECNDAQPLFEASSPSGECMPLEVARSSYALFCGPSVSASPSPSPSHGLQLRSGDFPAAAANFNGQAATPSPSPSPYPSQSPCAFCHPWGQLHQNAEHTSLSRGPGPITPNVAWSVHTGAGGVLASLSSSGVLFTACDGAGADSDSGVTVSSPFACALWVRYATPSVAWMQPVVLPEPDTQPAVGDNGLVFYVGSYQKTDGVYALDQLSGKLSWQNTKCTTTASLTLYGDALYLAGECYNGAAGAMQPALSALNSTTGAVLWTAFKSDPSTPYITPVTFGNNTVFVASAKSVSMFTASSGKRIGEGCWASANSTHATRTKIMYGADGTLSLVQYSERYSMNVVTACNSLGGGGWGSYGLSTVGPVNNAIALSSTGSVVAGYVEGTLAVSSHCSYGVWHSPVSATPQTVVIGGNGIVYTAAQASAGLITVQALSVVNGSQVWASNVTDTLADLVLTGEGGLLVIGANNVTAYLQ